MRNDFQVISTKCLSMYSSPSSFHISNVMLFSVLYNLQNTHSTPSSLKYFVSFITKTVFSGAVIFSFLSPIYPFMFFNSSSANIVFFVILEKKSENYFSDKTICYLLMEKLFLPNFHFFFHFFCQFTICFD